MRVAREQPFPYDKGGTVATQTSQDVVQIIAAQHREIRELFREVTNTGDRPSESFDQLVRLLAVHETAEEMVVYPALHRLGADGRRVADARKAEEDAAKKALAELEGLDRDSLQFVQMVNAFSVDVDEHAANEEAEVLPLLNTMGVDERRTMARAFLLAEKLAPTHAHRAAPESALGNMLVGPFVAMVDKGRDAI